MAYPVIIPSTGPYPAAVNFQYQEMSPLWVRCRDVVAGQARIRSKQETYLPRLPRQTDSQYEEYLGRARFFNATRRTVEGLNGLVFRKDVMYEWPRTKDPFINDVSLQSQTLNDYCEMMTSEVLTVGRGGTLIDYPRTEGSRLTVAEAERRNQRPYWTYFPAESILDWIYEPINNVPTLTYVKLAETVQTGEPDVDGHTFRYKTRYRVLDLVEGRGGMYYRIRLYDAGEPVAGSEDMALTETIIPTRGASRERLDFIPFKLHAPANHGWGVHYPPINDLVDSNLSHYQLKADHYHGLRYASLPQYWTAGVEEGEVPDTIGPHKIWGFTSPEARAGLLQYDGKGLEEVREEEKTLEHQMAMQGAKLLGEPQGYRESATSSSIRALGETATLGKMVQSLSKQFTDLLRWTAWWEGLVDKPSRGNIWVRLNLDFHQTIMDSQMVLALVNSWQQGAMSKETMFDNFKQGEIIPQERDFEEEKKLIKRDPPPPPPAPKGANGASRPDGTGNSKQVPKEQSPGPQIQK